MKKQKVNEGFILSVKKFTDEFFDGLKSKAINRALENAKKNPKIPSKIIDRMEEIDYLSSQLEDDLKKYS